jgi:hypothetical protein
MEAEISRSSGQDRHAAITAGAILCFVVGAGWLIGITPTIVHMIRFRELPIRNLPIIGPIRALSGPFEALGMSAMIGLALLFLVINLLHLLAGAWLWKSQRKGGVLEICLLALSAVFWLGFALPIPPFVGLLQVGLLAVGWKSLRAEPRKKAGCYWESARSERALAYRRR